MKYFIIFITGASIAWFTSHCLYSQYTSPESIANLASYSFYYGCIQNGLHDECVKKRNVFHQNILQISNLVL